MQVSYIILILIKIFSGNVFFAFDLLKADKNSTGNCELICVCQFVFCVCVCVCQFDKKLKENLEIFCYTITPENYKLDGRGSMKDTI